MPEEQSPELDDASSQQSRVIEKVNAQHIKRTWVITKIELGSTTAMFQRPTLWVNAVLHEPPKFLGAFATRAFYVLPELLNTAQVLNVGDEVAIELKDGLVIESMVDLELVRKGPVAWDQWRHDASL